MTNERCTYAKENCSPEKLAKFKDEREEKKKKKEMQKNTETPAKSLPRKD